MKYIDKLADNPWVNEHNNSTLEEIIDSCDGMINDILEQLDLITEIFEDSQKQINVYEEKRSSNSVVDYTNQIDAIKFYKGFFDVNARLLLIEVDFLTAYKYLMLSKTDWEYRFFARRIYTLIYETSNGFVKPSGAMMQSIKQFVGDKVHQSYDMNLKYMTQFLHNNENFFKEIRNKNEAHKDSVEIQIDTIQNLSIKESRKLIDEYYGNVISLSMSLIPIFCTLNKTISSL